VDAPCIRRYFSYLEQAKHYKRFSLQIVQVALRRFFRSMQLRRLIRTNPVGEFRIQVKHKEAVRTLPSPFELMRLLGSVSRHYQWLLGRRRAHRFSLFIHRRDLCIFSLCVACGLRRAELRRIQIADVDFEGSTIRVAGKGAGRFTIRERLAFFSHPFLQQVLHRYWKMREALPGSSFFCNWVGDPLTGRSMDDIFMTYNSFLRPPAPYNPTVLRKAFCTHLVHRKLNIAAIQVLMGHEKCETTLQYYVQLSPEQLEQTWKETTPYAHRL
jgi:site-specific recombinase XerD